MMGSDNRRQLHVLELFAGIGGGILGHLLCGHRIVCAVELDPYCRFVLIRRQNDGDIPPFPIWDDVRTFDGRLWRGVVDVVSGGFPCQNISPAGDRAGITGEKSSLWFEMLRVIREVRPRYVFVENSAGLIRNGLDVVLEGLDASGYDAEWSVLGASDVGAPHYRKRCWILAYANGRAAFPVSRGVGKKAKSAACHRKKNDSAGIARRASADERRHSLLGLAHQSRESSERNDKTDVPDSGCDGFVEWKRELSGNKQVARAGTDHRSGTPEYAFGEWWETESAICRVVDGCSHRLDRLKGLGNAQVPLCAAIAWKTLYERVRQSDIEGANQ